MISSMNAAPGAGATGSIAAWGSRAGTCSSVHKQSDIFVLNDRLGGEG